MNQRVTTQKERIRGMGLLFVCLMTLGMGHSLFFAIFPPLARGLGLSEVQASAIFTLSAVLWVLMSPFWGRRSDVWGRKPVILLGLVGFGVSTGGLATLLVIGQQGWLPLMTLYVLMIMIRSIFGLFGSGSPSAAQAYIADRTTREERTSGVAAIGAAFGMGTIIGPGFAAALASVHLLAPFFAVAVFALLGAVAIAVFLPERQKPAASQKDTPPLKITDKRIRLFLFLGVAVSTIGAAVMQVAAFFVMDTMHLTGKETAQVVGVGMMGMAMATLFAQLVIIPRISASVRVLLVSGILITMFGISLLLLPIMNSGLFAVSLTLQGLGSGLMRPAVAAGGSLAVEPEEQGAVAGFNSSTAAVGFVFVPVVLMPLYLYSPTAPFWVAFIITGLMLLTTRSKGLDVMEAPIDSDDLEEAVMTRPDRHKNY
ncbi:MAG: MFS transporter [Alphaproteobacteria bacterium]|nr:MFS transporter [Alphaproteobacteria bacterium]